MLIAQLSDIHVRPHGRLYKDVADSNANLMAAIDHLHRLDRRPDFVWVTGDLVDEGDAQEYATAGELLARLTMPFAVMAGNHDHRQNLRTAFKGHQYLPADGPLHYCIDDYPVRLIALDSTQPCLHHGRIDTDSLRWLRHTLDAAPDKPTLVALHHPPFVSGIPYMDEYRLFEADKLAAVIGDFTNVAAVLCGHVHRAMVARWAGTVVCACPSTATEIALQLSSSAQPKSYLGPPACMLHLWQPGHGLISHVSYTGQYPGPYPFF
jgi:3',5'-cyclic-AMP phosphodiesterase